MTERKSLIFRFEDVLVQEREFSVIRAGEVLSLEPRVFRVLTFLLRNPKRLVTKEELLDAVWNDCTVSENALARAVARLRQVLGDNTRQPRYIATVHTVGYRFLCDVEVSEDEAPPTAPPTDSRSPAALAASNLPLASPHHWVYWVAALFVIIATLGTIATLRQTRSPLASQRKLSRLTFHDGLETGASWSPDGQFFAYSSDRSGKSEIWVQQLSGGDAVQITSGPGANWQPDWSPDGKLIAFRSERGEGGLYATPSWVDRGRSASSPRSASIPAGPGTVPTSCSRRHPDPAETDCSWWQQTAANLVRFSRTSYSPMGIT